MIELQKKEKEDTNKSQKSEEHNGGKFEKGQEGECKTQTGHMKENKGSNSKLSIKEGKDADYPVMADNTMNSLNIIDLTITLLDKNKEENCKKVIHDERSKEYNESKKEKEKKVCFEEEPLEKQQQQQQQDINGELEHNIITSNNSFLDNTIHIQKDNNIDGGSKLPISDEKDHNYHRLKQGIPRSTKFRSIIDIYKHTKRLSSPKEEYNWSRTSNLENQKIEVHNEDKTVKDQVNTFEETLPNKLKRKVIHGEFESLGEHSQEDNVNRTLMENTDEEDHLNKGISERILFESLFDLCEAIIQHEIFEEQDESKTRKDQEVSTEEELPDQQQQNITGEPELNKVTSVDRFLNNFDCALNDSYANCGSKLLRRDENDGNYHIVQGIPRSKKFHSINSLYKRVTRLSPVEDEYNWNLSRGKDSSKDSNTNCLKKEDSSNKKNFGSKRKCREN